MISNGLHIVEGGIRALLRNARLLFISILLFVFPLLFVWLMHSFYASAQQNIESTERSSISLLHDSLSRLLIETEVDISESLEFLQTENQQLSRIEVVEQTETGYEIVASANPAVLNADFDRAELISTLPVSASAQSIIVPTSQGGDRVWLAFRRVTTDGAVHYIFTEHNFVSSDRLLLMRQQQAAFGLVFIFCFLLLLAYWVHRQEDWFRKHSALDKKLRERDEFTNMIAHEFRTPLTAIKGYASFLQDSENLNIDEKGHVTTIFTAAERLVSLVNDFLQVARIQSGKLEVTKELVNVEVVIKEVCTELRPIAVKHNLDLIYHEQQTALSLHTDKNRLKQILTNIITNSLKYTDSGHVEVEARQLAKKLVFKIKDTGQGISADDQRQLFGQFTRVGGADSSQVIGSGLGMWITKQLVELLGGTIGVESIEGVGTHVIITFPH